jgi:hypothetical protein
MSFTVEKKKIFNSFVRKTQKVPGDAKKCHRRVSLKSTGPGKFLVLNNLGWFGKENPEASDKETKFCDFVKMQLTQQG